jgi:hypothetical protein
MQPHKNNTKVILQIGGGVGILVAAYFGFTMLTSSDGAVTTTDSEIQVGKNFSVVQSIVNDKVNLDAISVLKSKYVQSLEDHTEIFARSTKHGRSDPFVPYDSTGPVR